MVNHSTGIDDGYRWAKKMFGQEGCWKGTVRAEHLWVDTPWMSPTINRKCTKQQWKCQQKKTGKDTTKKHKQINIFGPNQETEQASDGKVITKRQQGKPQEEHIDSTSAKEQQPLVSINYEKGREHINSQTAPYPWRKNVLLVSQRSTKYKTKWRFHASKSLWNLFRSKPWRADTHQFDYTKGLYKRGLPTAGGTVMGLPQILHQNRFPPQTIEDTSVDGHRYRQMI